MLRWLPKIINLIDDPLALFEPIRRLRARPSDTVGRISKSVELTSGRMRRDGLAGIT